MKRLRQQSLFNKLIKNKINFFTYGLLYSLYNKKEVADNLRCRINPVLYDYPNNVLTKRGKLLVESVDQMFKPLKNISASELMGDDYIQKITKYNEIFPKIKLPTQKYARTAVPNLEIKFKWFFENYNYTWDQIFKATEMYVTEYQATNYAYMRTSLYFIYKLDELKLPTSDLANYCDRVINGDSYKKEETFKTNVI